VPNAYFRPILRLREGLLSIGAGERPQSAPDSRRSTVKNDPERSVEFRQCGRSPRRNGEHSPLTVSGGRTHPFAQHVFMQARSRAMRTGRVADWHLRRTAETADCIGAAPR
jgi:hypothetical protein